MSSSAFSLPQPDADERTPYALVGQARARPGLANELEAALLSLVPPTRGEAGAMQYHVHRDRTDPELFIFYELWENVAALREHLAKPYVMAFLARRHELVLGEMDVRWLRMASPYPQ